MGQCGCGDTSIDQAFKLPSGIILATDVYRGCRECHEGPGVSVYVYPSRKAGRMWLDGIKAEAFVPDEYGGNSGKGIAVGLFEVRDLREAARGIDAKIGDGENDYATIDDWLHDFGLQMVQDAMSIFRKRTATGRKKKP
jgi:hypothetical protein